MPANRKSDYLAAVNERVVVFDGAFGTYVQDQDLSADDFGGEHLEGCNELLAITRPDLIAQMHEDFLKVGVDVLETATFGSFSTVLTEYGIADRAYEVTLAAARIAREVANSYESDGRSRYVAGSVGPGTKLPSLGHISFNELRDTYEEHARALIEGGALHRLQNRAAKVIAHVDCRVEGHLVSIGSENVRAGTDPLSCPCYSPIVRFSIGGRCYGEKSQESQGPKEA